VFPAEDVALAVEEDRLEQDMWVDGPGSRVFCLAWRCVCPRITTNFFSSLPSIAQIGYDRVNMVDLALPLKAIIRAVLIVSSSVKSNIL